MKGFREKVLDLLTVVMAISAIAIAVTTMRDRASAAPDPNQSRVIDDWEELADVGRRIGPADAAVVITEWGDYECPVCRFVEPRIETLLDTYPDDVALVYRHWPLSQHRNAYSSSRAAECAADQDAFESMHRALYADDAWSQAVDVREEYMRLAEENGVSDLDRFRTCISDETPHDRIEADMAAVRSIGGRGTPTLLVNDTYIGGHSVLESMVEDALREAGRE